MLKQLQVRIEELQEIKKERIEDFQELEKNLNNVKKIIESVNSRIDELEFAIKQAEVKKNEEAIEENKTEE